VDAHIEQSLLTIDARGRSSFLYPFCRQQGQTVAAAEAALASGARGAVALAVVVVDVFEAVEPVGRLGQRPACCTPCCVNLLQWFYHFVVSAVVLLVFSRAWRQRQLGD
jgi:hypothetical protein